MGRGDRHGHTYTVIHLRCHGQPKDCHSGVTETVDHHSFEFESPRVHSARHGAVPES